MSKDKPEIRFAGYTDAWEKRKLGEIGETHSGIGFPENEQGGKKGIPFFKVSDMNNFGNEHEMNVANNYVNDDQLERKKWKVINNVPGIIFAKVGAAIMLNRKRLIKVPFLMDNNTMEYAFDRSWNVYFGKTLFETLNLPKYAQVGALPSYNGSDIETISVEIPEKDEQERIGTFFQRLDQLITVNQRKVDLLKELKKGFLQKMFPKNGEDKPEIRFGGYTDAWEKHKFSEGMAEYTDRVMIQDDKDYPQLSVSNKGKLSLRGITNGKKIGRKRQAKINLKKHPNTLVFTRQTVEQGGIGLAPNAVDGAIVTENMPTIDVDTNVWNIDYLTAFFNTSQYYKNALLSNIEGGSAQVAIHEDKWLESEFSAAEFNEQNQIGTLFSTLNNLIVVNQRRVDLLKQEKKALLQKMFV